MHKDAGGAGGWCVRRSDAEHPPSDVFANTMIGLAEDPIGRRPRPRGRAAAILTDAFHAGKSSPESC